jgi:glycosyltransferase involved in cell wall biosynthesis
MSEPSNGFAAGRKLRVLHVISALAEEFGGPVNSCLETADALARLGHEVLVHSTDNGVRRRLAVPIGVPVPYRNFRIVYHRVLKTGGAEFSPGFARGMRSVRDFDIVHVHGLFNFPVSWTMGACRRLHVPYVVRPLGSLTVMSWKKRLALRLVERRNIEGAARIHFSTDLEEQDSRYLGLRNRRMVIPEGVERRDDPALLKSSAPIFGRYLVYLGRLHPQKGFDVLLPAFAKVAAERPDVTLAIAGPDGHHYKRHLEAECVRLGIRKRVLFPGMVTGNAKFELLAHSAGLVLPSHSESYGRVVVEAASCGAPVALSDRVGVASLAVAAGAGWASPLAPDTYARAVIEMLDADRKEMRAKAIAFARGLSWEACAATHDRMYAEILRERGLEAKA